jgi:acetylxylan esterase
MVNVLLGVHPELFSAGAAFAGVPFGGFATETGSWNDDCANGKLTKTGRQWGDIVRAAAPDHIGARPRIQLWHSTIDDILHPRNLHEAIKQWTDVHDVAAEPVLLDHPVAGWNRTRYGNASDTPPVEAISVAGSPHNVLVIGMARYTLAFFGLTPKAGRSKTVAPETADAVQGPPGESGRP